MRTQVSTFGLLITLGLAGLPALARAQHVGSEFQINAFTTSDQGVPSVASEASGNFVVVWQSYDQDGDGPGIFGQRYDSVGSALGGEFRVNSTTTDYQRGPSAASDASGNFVVAWQSFTQDGSSWGVFGQRYDSAGGALGAEFLVNSYTTGIQEDPSVASDPSGNFVVVWDGSGGADVAGVFGRRYDATGNALGTQFRVNSYITGTQSGSSVASDANGNFVIVWRSRYTYAGKFGVFGQRYNSEGVAQGGEFAVTSLPAGPQTSVVSDASGNFVVVWNTYTPISLHGGFSAEDVYGRRYDSTGMAQGLPFRVNSYTEYTTGRSSA